MIAITILFLRILDFFIKLFEANTLLTDLKNLGSCSYLLSEILASTENHIVLTFQLMASVLCSTKAFKVSHTHLAYLKIIMDNYLIKTSKTVFLYLIVVTPIFQE